MSIKVSSRKAKGRKLQYYVCEKIAELFKIKFDNQDEQCLIHSREMDQKGVDVILRGKCYTEFPFDIECKAVEKFNLYEAIKQAKENTKEGRYFLVVHKRKNDKPIVILDFETFLEFFKKIIKERSNDENNN